MSAVVDISALRVNIGDVSRRLYEKLNEEEQAAAAYTEYISKAEYQAVSIAGCIILHGSNVNLYSTGIDFRQQNLLTSSKRSLH